MTTHSARLMADLWRAVVRIDCRQTAAEYREDAEVVELCRAAKTNVRGALVKLAEGGYLLRDHEPTFWFAAGCKSPEGCVVPLWALAVKGPGIAGPREIVARAMPRDTMQETFSKHGSRFDFLRHPSRMGDRLHHHDGRVTDLDGKPIEPTA